MRTELDKALCNAYQQMMTEDRSVRTIAEANNAKPSTARTDSTYQAIMESYTGILSEEQTWRDIVKKHGMTKEGMAAASKEWAEIKAKKSKNEAIEEENLMEIASRIKSEGKVSTWAEAKEAAKKEIEEAKKAAAKDEEEAPPEDSKDAEVKDEAVDKEDADKEKEVVKEEDEKEDEEEAPKDEAVGKGSMTPPAQLKTTMEPGSTAIKKEEKDEDEDEEKADEAKKAKDEEDEDKEELSESKFKAIAEKYLAEMDDEEDEDKKKADEAKKKKEEEEEEDVDEAKKEDDEEDEEKVEEAKKEDDEDEPKTEGSDKGAIKPPVDIKPQMAK